MAIWYDKIDIFNFIFKQLQLKFIKYINKFIKLCFIEM